MEGQLLERAPATLGDAARPAPSSRSALPRSSYASQIRERELATESHPASSRTHRSMELGLISKSETPWPTPGTGHPPFNMTPSEQNMPIYPDCQPHDAT